MKTLRFVFGFVRRYKLSMGVAIVSMIALVAVELVSPLITRRLVGAVVDGSWDEAAIRLMTTLVLGLLGVYLLRMALQFISNYSAHIAGWGVVTDVRTHIYRHLQRLSLRFYEDQQVGQLMSRMVNDSDMFERLIAHAVPGLLVNVLMLAGVSAVLSTMNWRLMLLMLVPVPIILFAMRGFAKYVRPAFRVRQKELGELNATLNDNLSGIREIKVFTREDTEAHRITEHLIHYRDSLLHALKLMATFGPFVEFSSSLGYVIVLYFGGRLAFQQTMPVEDLVAFLLYVNLFYQPVRALAGTWEQVQEALAGADRVAELLDETPGVTSREGAVALTEPVDGDIAFEGVGFCYIENEQVLQDIDLRIPANSVVALVGPTGVGKTTMASLIPRFYDVTEGRITLDGRDLRDIELASLRRQIAMVLQDVFLFHGTVRENILFGRPGATEEEMIEAAQVANAHEFIVDLPDGYDTLIGERGVKLSGGQKQRVSIARAVLKDAPILILDEATSSVDTETELLIQQALDRLMEGRTTIVIAHRLSTIRNADLIVVLQENRIAEMGNHEQLMSHDGLYRHLNEVQRQIVPDSEQARTYSARRAEALRN